MEHANTAGTVKAQLADAVYQNGKLSVTGWLERLFTDAFKGLVYPQIWEDPVVDMEALQIGPSDHLVCIASGSCNTMSYLTANPSAITAVDLSPAHVALGRLKKAAAQHLPDHQAFHSFFGDANSADNIELYRRYIARHLDAPTRRWWDKRTGLGRRRIDGFATGFYRKGLLGRTIGFGHAMARLHGVDVRQMGAAATREEQIEIFERDISPLFDARLIRFLMSRRASLIGLGIPPAQYEALAGPEGDMAQVLRERTRKLACDFDLRDNYFAWQGFMRSYEPTPGGSRPPYLMAENFGAVSANAERLTLRNESFTDHLRGVADGARQGYVLLDAQDWMTDAQLNALWFQITRTAAPGARVIFRTAAEPDLLPGRVEQRLLDGWHYHSDTSKRLTANDRSAIYGGFHLYEKR